MKKNQNGSFILELMIGLLLSTITILGAMYVYMNFELPKRTTVQLGQTISIAAISLYPIQQSLKLAGYGNYSDLEKTGCEKIKTYNKNNNPKNFDLNFSKKPIEIIQGLDNKTSDTIIISYSKSEISSIEQESVMLEKDNNGNNANWQVVDNSSFKVGDFTLAYDLANKGECVLHQITDINNTKIVIHNNGQSQFNPLGGFGVSIPADSGRLLKIDYNGIPKKITFFIEDNQLKKIDEIYDNGNKATIGDNIVMLKAIYGLDTDGDNNVDTWKNDLYDNEFSLIRGIKVAIIARSPIRENMSLSGDSCFITTNKDFKWDNGNGNGIMDISNLEDWKCYRYRLLQTTVPIKNLIWPNLN